jgi:hypothetical protein
VAIRIVKLYWWATPQGHLIRGNTIHFGATRSRETKLLIATIKIRKPNLGIGSSTRD